MIKDVAALQEIRTSWDGVEILHDKLQQAVLGSIAQGGLFAIFVADAAHNLPFVHAYAVLNATLQQFAKEGRFTCKSHFLGKLLHASRRDLPWKEFFLIEQGVDRRNDVAHRGNVLPRADCWKYIDAIKNELVHWGVLDSSTSRKQRSVRLVVRTIDR